MNFFNDIGRGFQDFGNIINNEVIQPAETSINKEIIKPTETSINKEIIKAAQINFDRLKNDLSPNNITHTINTNINPKRITRQIINDPTLNKIIKPVQPTIQPIIKTTVEPIVNNLPTTINQTDLIDSSLIIGNQITDSISEAILPSKKLASDNTTLYIIIGAVLIGIYAFITNKKTVNNKI